MSLRKNGQAVIALGESAAQEIAKERGESGTALTEAASLGRICERARARSKRPDGQPHVSMIRSNDDND